MRTASLGDQNSLLTGSTGVPAELQADRAELTLQPD
jgi:hypothetical protein